VRALALGLWARLVRDDVAAYAAALAYSLLFALFPLGLALAGLAGPLGLAGAQAGFAAALTAVVPADVLRVVLRPHPDGPSLIGAGGLGYVWGMSSAFRRLIGVLDRAAGGAPPDRRTPWRRAVLSVALALTAGLALVGALVLGTVGQDLAHALGGPAPAAAVGLVRWAVLLLWALFLLAILYWVGPARRPPFRLVTPGAVAAIALWLGASFGFSVYLSHVHAYQNLYGGVGAVILLLVYLYLLSYALLVGAELNGLLGFGLPPGTDPWQREANAPRVRTRL
jgi:membrane protein